ncbi:hypothetical protein O0I10_003640 [Lichtheimia ornata]|uniref:Uncharacterized protein n=1 Tax=Lichtheimia ornata TaxID=688661 RepID=A0AAD7Y150_9FUNG|nr:uncharacterized protein O0I10_003640 [Lichtheimia ornata]KAJ8660593.1 hypothetical protein O0I10_003640 [Lichtheimia ornata]
MRFSFFTLAAATVCLAAGAFAAAPNASAESGASVAVAAERHSNSVAASAPSSVAAMQSAPAVQSSAAAVFVEKNDEIDEDTMETIQLGALEDIASLLVSLLAGILKAVIHLVLGGLGLDMTNAQVEQVQQEALEQIQALGGVDTLKQTVRAGGLQGLIDFIVNVVIPIIKKIKDAAGGAAPTGL